MMKICVFISLLAFFLNGYSQSSLKRIEVAISHIKEGYLIYGIEELIKCANNNDIIAQFYLGRCYENGYGVGKDLDKAFKFYRKSAERGLPDAMYYLALCYKNGIGVEINTSRFNEWMKRYNAKKKDKNLPDIYPFFEEGFLKYKNFSENPYTGSTHNESIVSNNSQINNVTVIHHISESTLPDSMNLYTKDNDKASHTLISEVDKEIPVSKNIADKKFALIIANENYQVAPKVSYSQNDGEIFAEYCIKTLGIPKLNVHLIKDATLNNIKYEVNLFRQIAEAYNGEASFIVYYAGHGIPDESTKESFLIPIDGYPSDTSTCYKIQDLYDTFGKFPATQIVMLIDACFSGSQRNAGMLSQSRGVVLKPKSNYLGGKMVTLSACKDDETAYPLDSEKHGAFTYFLLKKLKDSEGNVSLAELGEYIKENVLRQVLITEGKSQTPTLRHSTLIKDLNSLKL